MIRFVKQGILGSFLVFFYCASVGAQLRANEPFQLALEVDRNQVYQQAQVLLTLHIFHEAPLPELIDIIPPAVAEGRVRTLGLPSTQVEQGSSDNAFHTTQRYALFPDQVGPLDYEGPSLRLPSSSENDSSIISTQTPLITVLAKNGGMQWLPSENVILKDQTVPLPNDSSRYVRSVSMTAIGSLPQHLPEELLASEQHPGYQLLERNRDEFHSLQGITSQLQELWYVQPAPSNDVSSEPALSVTWWDTQTDALRQDSLPAPRLRQEVIEQPESLTQVPVATENTTNVTQTTPLALQIGIGALLVTTVLLASYVGFRYQHRKPSVPKRATQPAAQARQVTRSSPSKTHQAGARQAPLTNSMLEQQAFKDLHLACQQNACSQARSALVVWAAYFWPDHQITGTESIYRANVSQTLNYLLLDLEHHIQESQEPAWRGDLLLEAVKTLRRRRQ